jgi:hypothetical protein
LWKQSNRAERQKTAEGKMILFRSSFILPIMQAQNYKILLNLTFFLEYLLLWDYNLFNVIGIG